jgi:hypothetical protein
MVVVPVTEGEDNATGRVLPLRLSMIGKTELEETQIYEILTE